MASPRSGYDVLSEKLQQAKKMLINLNKNPNLTPVQRQQIIAFEAVSTQVIRECKKAADKQPLSELWKKVKPIIDKLKASSSKENVAVSESHASIDKVASLFETSDMQPIIMDVSYSDEEHEELFAEPAARTHARSVMSREGDEFDVGEEEFINGKKKQPSSVMFHISNNEPASAESYLNPKKQQRPGQVMFHTRQHSETNLGQAELVDPRARAIQVLQMDDEPEVKVEEINAYQTTPVTVIITMLEKHVNKYLEFISAFLQDAKDETRKDIMKTLQTKLTNVQTVLKTNKDNLDLSELTNIFEAAKQVPPAINRAAYAIKETGKDPFGEKPFLSKLTNKTSITETFNHYQKDRSIFKSLVMALKDELQRKIDESPRPRTP